MNTRIGLLAILCGIQILLVAALLGRDAFETPEGATLLDFDPAGITRVVIEESDAKVELTKTGDGWRIDGGYPGDAARIGELVDKLAGLTAPWPVATTEDAAERFEVTDAGHQRRITLSTASADVADLLLGTSPGYRRIHARRAGSDEIYSIDLASHEVPADADHLLDKGVLAAIGTITAVARTDAWRLERTDDSWTVDGSPADQEAAAKLADRFASLQVLGIAGELAWTDEAVFEVTDDAGTAKFTAFHAQTEDEYAFESDRIEGRYTVAGYLAEQMMVDASSFEAKPAATQESAEPGGEEQETGADS
jgi:hypothetical protein